MSDLLVAVIACWAVWFAFQPAPEEEDEDLAWVDDQIRRAEDGPHDYEATLDPDRLAARRDHLARLHALRRKLLKDSA